VSIIKLILVIILAIPFLCVTGIVVSSADVLGPILVGTFVIEPNQVSDFGRSLTSATEALMHKEIDFVLSLTSKVNSGSLR